MGCGSGRVQDLLLTAPVTALPLVRRIAEHAYRAGAGLVTPILSDEEVTLARYRFAQEQSFGRAAGWLYDGIAKAFSEDTARARHRRRQSGCCFPVRIPAKVARANKANSVAYQPALEKIAEAFDINWNIVAYPGASSAGEGSASSPDEEEHAAVARLADAIFAASRVDNDDPDRGMGGP